eukprot:2388559-Rhodomonas_salina.4
MRCEEKQHKGRGGGHSSRVECVGWAEGDRSVVCEIREGEREREGTREEGGKELRESEGGLSLIHISEPTRPRLI